jgi:hypothetical protein
MDWQTLKDSMRLEDNDYPQRRADIVALARVLDGAQYDHLPAPFSMERNAAGGYLPLDQRRPSVRTHWGRTVVDDSVSMLFGQGRWPQPSAPAEDGAENPTVDALKRLTEATQLASTMIEAATIGSVGSVAILLRVLRNKPYFDAMSTAYLTPEYDPEAPRTLLRVTEKRKVDRAGLETTGYTGLPANVTWFWFQRQWTATEETWFVPWPAGPLADKAHVPVRDAGRSAVHGLGVVPIVWVRNLPGGSGVDGACTFAAGINTEIEADYQLSQGGRGLKYAADPTLMIKEPAGVDGLPARVGGAASALIVADNGDAKLLEISGSASAAVIDYVTHLHKCAMGAMHGDSSDRDKMAAAQSGRAMELMKQPLVWLTSKLRMSYGDGALVDLLRLVCLASTKIKGGVFCGDTAETALDPAGLTLVWPPFFHPTYDDKAAEASAVRELVDGAAMSRRAAVMSVAHSYDLADVDAELAAIAADEAAQTALLTARRAQVQMRGVSDA